MCDSISSTSASRTPQEPKKEIATAWANDLAARLVRRLEVFYAEKGRLAELRDALSRFYARGQAEKIQFARAA